MVEVGQGDTVNGRPIMWGLGERPSDDDFRAALREHCKAQEELTDAEQAWQAMSG